MGTFAAVQVAGLTLAPRSAVRSARRAGGLRSPSSAGRSRSRPRLAVRSLTERRGARPTFVSLLNRWMGLVAATATAGYLGFTAIGFVVALVVSQEFGLSSGRPASSWPLTASAASFGRYAGTVADPRGGPRTALLGTLACAAGVLGLAFAPSAWALALVYFAVGCAGAFVWAGLNTIVVEIVPREPGRRGLGLQRVQVRAACRSHRSSTCRSSTSTTRLPFLVATGFSALSACSSCPGSGATGHGQRRCPAASTR